MYSYKRTGVNINLIFAYLNKDWNCLTIFFVFLLFPHYFFSIFLLFPPLRFAILVNKTDSFIVSSFFSSFINCSNIFYSNDIVLCFVKTLQCVFFTFFLLFYFYLKLNSKYPVLKNLTEQMRYHKWCKMFFLSYFYDKTQ